MTKSEDECRACMQASKAIDKSQMDLTEASRHVLKDLLREETGEAARELRERVSTLEKGHIALHAKVDENTKITTAILCDTSALVEFAENYRMTKKIGSIAGKLVMWFALVSGGFATVWAALKSGRLP